MTFRRTILLLLAILCPWSVSCGAAPQESATMWKPATESFKGPLPAATDAEKKVAENLKAHITSLATSIGPRHVGQMKGLNAAEDYIKMVMWGMGYKIEAQPYTARGVEVKNLEAEIKGTTRPEEILILGAHYDSVPGSPAANDNGSGVAAVVELARLLKDSKPACTIRFVFFVNEEPPFFQTDLMGSVVYAKRCRGRKEKIVGMLSLETIGFYADAPGTQKYPPPFDKYFPSEGNFIAFVGDTTSKPLVEGAINSFRKTTKFPSEAIAAPTQIQGIGFSDQWSFWQQGYPALMVTDTAMFRYAHYHTAEDTPEKLDYDRMSRVVMGVSQVSRTLAE